MLSERHSLNLKLYSKQYNKKIVLHLIVVSQLSSCWQHNYSTKTRLWQWAVYVFSYVYDASNEGLSAASFCRQAAALHPDMFDGFYLTKIYKIGKKLYNR